MSDHRVSSLRAAVELAESWRIAGTHTWFRGQNRPWPLMTSLARRLGDAEEVSKIEGRIGLFCKWLEGVPELRHLLEEENMDACFAILQHYGVPTHYIDFTVNPRVAGFFAGVGPCATPGKEGCIIAINPDEWVEMLRSVAEVRRWHPDAWPEKIVVEVPNLWRMEVQSGHFIYLPVGNAKAIYPYDRIIFPHDHSAFELTEEEIYPSRKSHLEQLLDEFFTMELMTSNHEHLRELARVWAAQGQQAAWLTMERPESTKWLRPGRAAHESWESVSPEWSSYVHEAFGEARDETTQTLSLDATELRQNCDKLHEAVRRFLAENPQARRKAINWKVVPVTPTPESWIRFVESAVGRAWDGVRRLPFTDEQVAAALAMTVTLACVDVSETPSYRMQDFAGVLGPTIPIELANAQNVTARAAMANATYERALRPDLNEVLVPELLGRPREQLRQILSPSHMFDFSRLVDAFARELIPTQILVQRPDLAVFFSPTQVSVIGAP